MRRGKASKLINWAMNRTELRYPAEYDATQRFFFSSSLVTMMQKTTKLFRKGEAVEETLEKNFLYPIGSIMISQIAFANR